MTDTEKRLAEIRERAQKATQWHSDDCEIKQTNEGPRAVQGAHIGDTLIALDDVYENSGNDWNFIAHSREDIPFLLSQVEALQQDKARLEWLACTFSFSASYNEDYSFPWDFRCNNRGCFTGKSVREAIDAAMAQQPNQPSE